MSGPNPQQLQRHKDSVRDTLQGLLDTAAQVPALIHEQSSKELAAVTAATALREGACQHTQEALDALPAELSAFDQVLDQLLTSAHAISTGLGTLRGFNNRSPIRPQARLPLQPQQEQQQQQQQQQQELQQPQGQQEQEQLRQAGQEQEQEQRKEEAQF